MTTLSRRKLLKTSLLSAAALGAAARLPEASAANRTNNQKKDTTMTQLTGRERAIILVACNEAKGDIAALENALSDGLARGLTVQDAKEVLSQLYAYTGFPRSLNALGALGRVLEKKRKAGEAVAEGKAADPLPRDFSALEAGTRVQTQLAGGKPFNYTFVPATDYYLKAHLFGDIFARNNLTHAERELATVSALCGMSGVEPQLRAHTSGALNLGLEPGKLRAIAGVLESSGLLAEGARCRKAVAATFKEPLDETALAKANRIGLEGSPYPVGSPNTAYAKYFIGNSYLAMLDAEKGGPVNVTFEPGCRNNWHIHHKQVQVLICVAGRGWYQEEGKEAVALVPGVVIAIPADVKHWHGAARDSWMQHLTYHTKVEAGASNEWCEPVMDGVYGKLP